MSDLPKGDADPSEDIAAIRNLGPAAAAAFARAGIHTASELYALGADEAYRRQLLAGAHPHFISYYVLVMGLQGRPWNDAQGDEKAALRARFDAIKAAVQAVGIVELDGKPTGKLQPKLERELRQVGVVSSS